jgi:hypothetical protein
LKHIIGITKNDMSVYVDLIHSRAAKHISAQPQLLMFIKEAVRAQSPTKDHVSLELNMGRSVGYDFTVPTTEKDVIFYAQLIKSTVFTPFIKNGAPTATTHLSIVLSKTSETEYELLDAWIGDMSPGLPGSTEETKESTPYWSSHAVVYTNQALQTRSITKVNPYQN